MGSSVPRPPPLSAGELLKVAVSSGDLDRARELFNQVFWRNEKLAPRWEHLKIALLREDKPMTRLLVTWGARAPEFSHELRDIPPGKYGAYAKILRQYGLDATAVETAAAEPLPAVIAAPSVLQSPEIGEMVPGQGVYLGQYKPKDRDGKSLSKTFNVFAAPEDLPETMKYVDAVKYIAELKKWNGYDGTNYATDKEFYAAVKNGSYNGGWIIPTRDILHGKDVDGKDTTPDNILAHKDKGVLQGTFKMTASSGSVCPDWYWSSTEYRDVPSLVWDVRLSGGYGGWHRKDGSRLSCRPVRLLEVRDGEKSAKNNNVERRFSSTGFALPSPPPGVR